MAGIFGIGISGLNAAQANLIATGHNISNANTPGYHRQIAEQTTNQPAGSGAGFQGAGVRIETVRRTYSQFLDNQVVSAQTQSSQLEAYLAQVKQLDDVLADPSAGLSPALQEFFTGVGDLVANPASVPARQSMLGGADILVARFQALNQRFDEIRHGLDTEIEQSVTSINSYARQIAELNTKILTAEASFQQPANDLQDQRDQLVAKLNEQVRSTIVRQSDGTYNVFIGNGQSLVVGAQSYPLVAEQGLLGDPQQLDIAYAINSSTLALDPSTLQGGALGGLLAFRRETLDPSQNALGRAALGIALSFNEQHRLGQDLNGTAGGDFFSVPNPTAVGMLSNKGTGAPTVTIQDLSQLTTSDYQLRFDAGTYTLLRLSDNAAVATVAAPATLPVVADGMLISAGNWTPQDGDSMFIHPARAAARDIAVVSHDTARVAAAAPMRTSAANTNTGTGKVSAGTVDSPVGNVTLRFNATATAFDVIDNTTGGTLAAAVAYTGANQLVQYPAGTGWPVQISAPAANEQIVINKAQVTAPTAAVTPAVDNQVTLTFTSANTFDVVDATRGVTLAAGVAYTAGADISYNGWTVQVSGVPASGDVFRIGPNTGGTADNRNGVALAALQTRNVLVGGTASVQGAYSQMVSAVGSKAREMDVTAKAQANLVLQTKDAQQSFSGVNLDEEAANLLRYQQAYQAAGKMIQIASTLFDTLLGLGH